MKINVIESGATSATLEIEVPKERVSEEYERIFKREAASASLPGFRRGKVPRPVLEKRLGPSVEQEALNDILPKATLEAVREKKLRMVGVPRIEHLDFKPSKDLLFKARIELKPEVSLKGSLEGFKLSAPKAEPTKEEMEREERQLRERQAVIGNELERPAAEGDHLLMDFEGRIDDVPFPGGKAENYAAVLGRKQLIPGFEEGLIGVKKGETRQLKVEFPKDYQGQDVAGKKAVFLVNVKEVREVQLPELNDEFAKSLGGVENLEDMRAAIRRVISSQKERLRRAKLMDQAANLLLESHKALAVPEAMLEAEANVLMEREVSTLRERGMEVSGEEGLTAMREKLRPAAERRARLSLVLEAVADKLEITVSEQEYEEDMAKAAPQLGVSREQLVKWMKREGREGGVKARLREEKALNFIIEKADIKEEA